MVSSAELQCCQRPVRSRIVTFPIEEYDALVKTQQSEQAPHTGKRWKKWKPGIWGRFKDVLMSPYFKACAQLASGSQSNSAMHCLALSLQGLHWSVIAEHINGAWRHENQHSADF